MQSSLLQAVLFDLDDTLHDDTDSYRRTSERVAEDIAQACAVCSVDAKALLRAYVTEADSFWQNLSDHQIKERSIGFRQRLLHSAMRAMGIDDMALSSQAAAA